MTTPPPSDTPRADQWADHPWAQLGRVVKSSASHAEVGRIVRQRWEALWAEGRSLRAALAEAEREMVALPCDGLCTDYPEEDCSRHGRKPAELWAALSEQSEAVTHWKARAEQAERERDAWQRTAERHDDLREQAERQARELPEQIEALRSGAAVRLPLLQGEDAATTRGWIAALDEVTDLLARDHTKGGE